MAVYTSAAMTLRRKLIIDALKSASAVDASSAKRLSETDLPNPESSPGLIEQLVAMHVIYRTEDGKYYIDH